MTLLRKICIMPGCGRRAVHGHHLVKQQKIRARWRTLRYRAGGKPPYKLTAALTDPRLKVPVCALHHEEEKPMPIPDEAAFWAAVADYGLEPDLPRWLAARCS